MKKSIIIAEFTSDVLKIEVLDDNTFVEYYPNGNSTKFIITKK